jgi:hypothetical protein
MEWSLRETIGIKGMVKMGKEFNKKAIKMDVIPNS